MALTKLPKNAIADDAVNADKIADGTIQNQDVQGSISNDKLENSSFTLNGTEVSLGASQSVITYLDWQAVQVADGSTQVNAESGKGYFLDTNAGVIEVFLPTSPSRGDVVGLVDYAGTFGTNQLIINTGGINIDSTVGSEFKVTTNNAIVECVYVDAAKGWLVYLNQAAGTTPDSALTGFSSSYDTVEPQFISATGGTVTESGDYKIHTFTGDGCFVVSCAGSGIPSHPSTVDYLVVAGGGGGGSVLGGGGGGGGFRESSGTATGCYSASPLGACVAGLPLSVTTYPITVGSGGTGNVYPGGAATAGSNSVFSTITSTGGGLGGGSPGGPGGSGGGANSNPAGVAGSGNTPPTSPSQGNPGGTGFDTAGGGVGWKVSGSGGGAIGVGGTALSPGPANTYNSAEDRAGGAGATTSISGSPTSYSGGGGGSMETGTFGSIPIAPGGLGGGGSGGSVPGAGPFPTTIVNSTVGTANTGGGGGGGAERAGPNDVASGKNGGKGIVIIRYKFQ